jgi:hypothetical protein
LFVRGLAYCGAEETGGFIPTEIVPSLIRRRRHGAAVEALVARSLWVVASGDRGQPGYRVTRWEDWQEELEALARRRAADRERKRRERASKQNGRVDGHEKQQFKGMSRDMSTGTSADSPHPESKSQRQRQKNYGGTGSQSSTGRRRAREMLNDRYGLTDNESDQVIAEVQARARDDITDLVAYMDGMALGDLARVVDDVTIRGDQRKHASSRDSQPLAVVPDWCGRCDEHTRLVELDDGRVARCADCNPNITREAS